MLRRKLLIVTGALALTLPTLAYAETGADRFDRSPHQSALITTFRPAAATPDAKVTVMVELTGDPVAVAQAEAGTTLSSARASEIRAGLKKSQDKLKLDIEHRGGTVLSQMQSAFNGMRVTLPRKQVKTVAALPAVKSVTAARVYHLENTVSVPFLGVPKVWENSKYHGEGVKVAIIDTGIDYTHADFGGPGTVDAFNDAKKNEGKPANPAWFGPNAPRVKGGYDFVGNDYNADPSADDYQPIARPDANPLDCEGHGSHVSGTAAGSGVTADGKTYTGAYDSKTPNMRFKVGPGVAPKADLYALKVFGCTGSTDVVTEAIDWAVKNHMDVVNLSLGSEFGTANDADSVAAQNAQAAGVVVVASSGNAGPNPYLSGSPGVARGVVGVSAVDSTARFPGALLTIGSKTVAAINANDAALPTEPLTVVYVTDDKGTTETDESLGCSKEAFTKAGVSAGKHQIAVVQRGSCARAAKAIFGQEAGAAAVVMVNNAADYPPFEGTITANPDDDTPADVTIPFLGVRNSDDAALKNADGTTLTLSAKVLKNPGYRRYASFSSAGPRTGDSGLKPAISAPGVNISSAAVGTGSDSTVLSGTSMASPHVAGVAALARQAHKTWKAGEIASALVSTADPANVTGYRLTWGGGLVDTKQVVGTKVYAYGDTAKSSGGGKVYDATLSFGFSEPSSSYQGTRTLTLVNKGSKKVTFSLSHQKTKQSRRASVSFSPRRVTVAASKSRTVKVTLRAKASQLGGSMSRTDQFGFREVSGNVTISTSGGNGTLRVPYLLVPRAQAKVAASQKVVTISPAPTTAEKPDTASSSSPSPSTNPNPGTGPSTSPSPTTPPAVRRALDVTLTNRKGALTTTADFYTWGQSDKRDLPAEAPGGVDLRASGVKSLPNGKDQLLVFAVNSWTRWSNAAATEFDVEVDTNGDGDADYIVFSTDSGHTRTGDVDGLTEVFVLDVAKDEVTVSSTDGRGYLATAPTDSSTILLPVDASLLGLDITSGSFRYAVSSYSNLDASVSDEMGNWVAYDLANAPIANGVYRTVKVGQTTTVRLAVDTGAVQRLKPLGTMVVVVDNKAGKHEALLLPTPTF